MPSVCFVGNYRSLGGAFEVFRNIAREMKAAGWKTAYYCHAEYPDEKRPDASMFDEIECINSDLWGDDREAYGAALAEKCNQFDVVHHSLLPQHWRYCFKNKLTRPQVEQYHSADGWLWCWDKFEWRLRGGVEKRADVTVAVSNGLARLIRRDLQGDVKMIYNGVAVPSTIAAGGDYVTYCGRIEEKKGISDWLKVAVRVRETLPQAKFQWVGDISACHDSTAITWIKAACPWIECVGFQEDPTPFYQRSRCLLLTSPSEGLPMTILEAQAQGIPAVAFGSGDVQETGAFIARDVDQACSMIVEAFGNGRMECLAESLRLHMRNKFGREAMGRNYLALYEYLLKWGPAC